MLYRNGNYPHFSISDFNRICDPGGFNVQQPYVSIQNIRRKVGTKVRDLQHQYPDAKEEYLALKAELKALGVTPQTTYLYIQGHHLFDTVVAPILSKVCNQLRQERQNEIYHAKAHKTQKRNEMSCYENSLQDVKVMLKKNGGYINAEPFLRLQNDIKTFMESLKTEN
jgi:cephalosporin-C deacetylase-like acetyl esterase